MTHALWGMIYALLTLSFSLSGLFRYDIEVILVKDNFLCNVVFCDSLKYLLQIKVRYGCVPAYYNSKTWCTKATTLTNKTPPLIVTHAFTLYIKMRRHVCTYTYICTKMFANIIENIIVKINKFRQQQNLNQAHLHNQQSSHINVIIQLKCAKVYLCAYICRQRYDAC